MVTERSTDLRARIVRAAADLLTNGGLDAVSTRAVSAAAGVQPPAIYRQFEDMQGLLLAAAREVFAGHMRQKRRHGPTDDALEDLRKGWDAHVAFGLANPAAYTLLFGSAIARKEPEVRDGFAALEALVARVATAGRLGVPVPHAAEMIHAGACGVTLALLARHPEDRDAGLSTSMRDTVLAAITTKPASKGSTGPRRVAARAVALHAVIDESGDALSAGERALLSEWLDRLAASRMVSG